MNKERPILFSGPMVRAILEGRKTQTRRVFKGSSFDLSLWMAGQANPPSNNPNVKVKCPYGNPGDRLWVRETFSYTNGCTVEKPIWYWADGNPEHGDFTRPKPSIHMPRWASRILLEITAVRVERLQDISEEDALAEGVCCFYAGASPEFTHAKEFEYLWGEINSPESWEANPWVWVVEFKVVEVG